MLKIDWALVYEIIRSLPEFLCRHFFPNGRRVGNEWWIGNLAGEAGDSLKFELAEPGKEGVYFDFATKQGGNMLSAIMAARSCTIAQAAELIGQATGRPIDNGAGTASPPPNPGAQYYQSAAGATAAAGAIDWDRDYRPGPKQLEELAAWRGLSIEFCRWLADKRLIGRHGSHWVFPVHDSAGNIVAVHKRIDKNKWTFVPSLKSLGLALAAFVIGDLAAAIRIIAGESQWDLLVALDKLGIHNGEPIAAIATRGAANARLIGNIQFAGELYAIGQNDAAGTDWLATLKTIRPFKWIPVPAAYHDAGEWLAAPGACAEFVAAFLAAKAYKGPRPSWLAPNRLEDFSDKEPEQILEGVFCDGQIVSVQGGSKGRKTFFLAQILYCIANGLPFLRIPTLKRKSLNIDLESQPPFIRKRFEQIQAALGAGNFDNLRFLSLRGQTHLLDQAVLDAMADMIEEELYRLFDIDPIYKLLGDRQENETRGVAQMLAPFVTITERLNNTFFYAHHYAKGDQSQRDAIDRGSGSGVFGRLPDAIFNLTRLAEPNTYRLEIIQRNYPEIAPFGIRWQNGIFFRDDDLNPDLKKANAGKTHNAKYIAPEAALAFITVLEEITRFEYVERLIKPAKNGQPFCAKSRAYEILQALVDTGRLIERKEGRKLFLKKS